MTTVLTLLVGVTFMLTGGVKIVGVRQSLEIRDHLGVAPGLWPVIGVLEALGAVGTLVGLGVPIIGTLALAGLALLMLGAVGSRIRVHDKASAIAMDIAVLGLVVLVLVLHLR